MPEQGNIMNGVRRIGAAMAAVLAASGCGQASDDKTALARLDQDLALGDSLPRLLPPVQERGVGD